MEEWFFLSYIALYRQWRPQTFKDVVGQEHITRTLQNQIIGGRIAHAYLFSGSRGTGKTTTAKIFARAVNCRNPVHGEPCGKCEVCEKLSSNNVMDIIEIDAASNNGVDEVRDLREKAKFPPTVGRYKVYIIDEVHMLSAGAFNALLKTLEEPPLHIIFILATTEPQKLPATILSRCQRYDFHRISMEAMVGRLKTVAEGVGAHFDEEGIRMIARAAEGGMRDALSIMDQCISFWGDHVSYKNVVEVLGTADQSFLFEIAGEILYGNTPAVLKCVDKLVAEGRDISVFLRDLVLHFRNLLLVMTCGDCSDILDVTRETLEEYQAQCRETNRERLIRAIEGLTSLEADMKWSSQPRILLEVALIKICRPERETSYEALMDRVQRLEDMIRKGTVVAGSPAPAEKAAPKPVEAQPAEPLTVPQDVSADASTAKKKELPPEDATPPAGIPKEVSKELSTETWKDIMKAIKKERMATYTLIHEGEFAGTRGNNLLISFGEEGGFFISALEKEENRKYIESVIKRVTGREFSVKFIIGKPEEEAVPEVDDRQLFINKAIELFGADKVEIVEDELEE